MKQKILIESLSMDLLRVALGLHRRSFAMARRFAEEVLQRQKELESEKLDSYLLELLQKSKKIVKKLDEKNAEDVLMYSILFQNFVQKKY